MNSFKRFLHCFLPLIAMIALQAITSTVTMLIILIPKVSDIRYAADYEEQVSQYTSDGLVIAVIVSSLATCLLGVIWYHKKYRTQSDLPLRKVASVESVSYVIVLALSTAMMICTVLCIINRLSPAALNEYKNVMEDARIGSSFVVVIITIIIAPIGEEYLFRGITFSEARKILPFAFANLLQAVIFGIAHMNLVQGIYTFFLGLLFGLVRYKFRCVKMSILCHLMFNIFGQTIPYFFSKASILILGIVFSAGALLCFATVYYIYHIQIVEQVAEVCNSINEKTQWWENNGK